MLNERYCYFAETTLLLNKYTVYITCGYINSARSEMQKLLLESMTYFRVTYSHEANVGKQR